MQLYSETTVEFNAAVDWSVHLQEVKASKPAEDEEEPAEEEQEPEDKTPLYPDDWSPIEFSVQDIHVFDMRTWPALEIAVCIRVPLLQFLQRQLSILEGTTFRKIHAYELIDGRYSQKKMDYAAPNVAKMIARFNNVCLRTMLHSNS